MVRVVRLDALNVAVELRAIEELLPRPRQKRRFPCVAMTAFSDGVSIACVSAECDLGSPGRCPSPCRPDAHTTTQSKAGESREPRGGSTPHDWVFLWAAGFCPLAPLFGRARGSRASDSQALAQPLHQIHHLAGRGRLRRRADAAFRPSSAPGSASSGSRGIRRCISTDPIRRQGCRSASSPCRARALRTLSPGRESRADRRPPAHPHSAAASGRSHRR